MSAKGSMYAAPYTARTVCEFVSSSFDIVLLLLNTDPSDLNASRNFSIFGFFVHRGDMREKQSFPQEFNETCAE